MNKVQHSNGLCEEHGVVAISYNGVKLPLRPSQVRFLSRLLKGPAHWQGLGSNHGSVRVLLCYMNRMFRDMRLPFTVRSRFPYGAGDGFYELHKAGHGVPLEKERSTSLPMRESANAGDARQTKGK